VALREGGYFAERAGVEYLFITIAAAVVFEVLIALIAGRFLQRSSKLSHAAKSKPCPLAPEGPARTVAAAERLTQNDQS
jgi:hypothetical protein